MIIILNTVQENSQCTLHSVPKFRHKMRNFRSQMQKQCHFEDFFFCIFWYRSDLWILALAMRHQVSFLLQNRALQILLLSSSCYTLLISHTPEDALLSVLFNQFRVFNSEGRHLCDFQDLFLMEQHMSQGGSSYAWSLRSFSQFSPTAQSSETLVLQLKKEHYLLSVENTWHFKHPNSFCWDQFLMRNIFINLINIHPMA